MEAGQRIRGKILEPFLQAMSRGGIKPNDLTFLSLVFGILSAVMLVLYWPVGLALLFVHVLLDGIDGPLARYEGTESNVGSFVDTAADQTVIVAVTCALVFLGVASPLAGILYVFSYTTVVGFAFVRNSLGIPYSWLLRPRFLVYSWLFLEFTIFSGSLDYVLWACNILLALKVMTGFVQIKRRL